jgi:pyrroline-5-carboxylate reductase
MQTNTMKIGFVGGGNMATALIGGLVGRLSAAEQIHVVDPNADALRALARQFGVSTANEMGAALAACDVIVLAVKPQQMKAVAAQLRPHVGAQLVLSIAAGIRAVDLSRWLGGYAAIVRAMPNTPALIAQGITGLVAMRGVSSAQRSAADAVMQAVGATLWFDHEEGIDAVTAVSGSGPAYVFYFLEAMQQAALELGLSPEQGKTLALATFHGASQLAMQSSEALSVLRERVTSKGGTTHAALASMESAGVKEAIVAAVKAAAARSRELGEEFGRD